MAAKDASDGGTADGLAARIAAADEAAKASLPKTSSVMASATARVYAALPGPGDAKWVPTGLTGRLHFVLDRVPTSTCRFLLYAVEESDAAAAAASERAARAPARPKSKRGGGVAAAIEVELYQDIDYRQLSPRFHAFEAEWFVVGFAFASEAEAKKLLSKVKGLRPRADTTPPPQHLFVSRGDSWSNRFKRMLGFGPATPPPRAPPPVVSTVTEFKHTTHVGMNEDGSWDLQNLPHEWKQMFKAAGIRKRDLKDTQTAMEIFKIVSEVTGEETIVPETVEEGDEEGTDGDDSGSSGSGSEGSGSAASEAPPPPAAQDAAASDATRDGDGTRRESPAEPSAEPADVGPGGSAEAAAETATHAPVAVTEADGDVGAPPPETAPVEAAAPPPPQETMPPPPPPENLAPPPPPAEALPPPAPPEDAGAGEAPPAADAAEEQEAPEAPIEQLEGLTPPLASAADPPPPPLEGHAGVADADAGAVEAEAAAEAAAAAAGEEEVDDAALAEEAEVDVTASEATGAEEGEVVDAEMLAQYAAEGWFWEEDPETGEYGWVAHEEWVQPEGGEDVGAPDEGAGESEAADAAGGAGGDGGSAAGDGAMPRTFAGNAFASELAAVAKKKEQRKQAKPAPKARPSIVERAAARPFMADIKSGVKGLRRVTRPSVARMNLPKLKKLGAGQQATLMDKLTATMEARRQFIQDSDSDGTDSDWSDSD